MAFLAVYLALHGSLHEADNPCGTILLEYCEKDHTLGYELLKRMSEVMTRRLQAARGRPVETHARGGSKASNLRHPCADGFRIKHTKKK